MSENNEILISLLGLSKLPGIGKKTLEHFYDSGLLLNYYALKEDEIYSILDSAPTKISLQNIEKIQADKDLILTEGKAESLLCSEGDIRFIHINHTDYPIKFKDIENPPRWFFFKGDLERTKDHCIVSIIGTRNYTTEGRILTEEVTDILVSLNITTLSGLAKGIDYFSHLRTINKAGKNIGIIAHGFLGQYKSYKSDLEFEILENDGLIITEYLPFQQPHRSYFLRRNELVASLSDFVIPIEMPDLKSGTASTVRRANKMNRNIISVMVDTNSESLIKTNENLSNFHAKEINLNQLENFMVKENKP